VKIELPKEPKELRSFVFTELNLVELNSIAVDRLLPHIYESAIKGGRHAGALKDASATAYESKYLPSLIAHEDIHGFDTSDGRDVADAWLRSSVVAFGRSGVAQRVEKMDFIRARTLAAYRAGFPDRRRSRQADTVTYAQMLSDIRRRQESGLIAKDANEMQVLRELVQRSVGEGVEITDPPYWAPKYDGHTPVDITTLLTLHFLEGFEPIAAGPAETDAKSVTRRRDAGYREHPPVPAAAAPLGSDVVNYLLAYGKSTPLLTAKHLTSLLGIRLFQLPLRTALAVRKLMQEADLPSDMATQDGPNPLEQYVDFSNDASAGASEIARACVQRDVRLMHAGLKDRLLLKTVRRALEVSGRIPNDYNKMSGPDRLSYLVEMANDPGLEPYFGMDLHLIRQANEDSQDEDTKAFFEELSSSDQPVLQRLIDVLFEATKARARHAALSWFRDTGGLNRANGILQGDSRNRGSWRYAPGNDLVTALLGVVFVDNRGRHRNEMLLSDVLTELTSKFGILIDRPPTGMDSVAARSAASVNLDAFKRRLKLLGVFDGLSDDFNAQTVLNPLRFGGNQ